MSALVKAVAQAFSSKIILQKFSLLIKFENYSYKHNIWYCLLSFFLRLKFFLHRVKESFSHLHYSQLTILPFSYVNAFFPTWHWRYNPHARNLFEKGKHTITITWRRKEPVYTKCKQRQATEGASHRESRPDSCSPTKIMSSKNSAQGST